MINPFVKPLNERTVTVKIKRGELVDLMRALTAISSSMDNEGLSHDKWDTLHDKLKAIRDEFDSKQEL